MVYKLGGRRYGILVSIVCMTIFYGKIQLVGNFAGKHRHSPPSMIET